MNSNWSPVGNCRHRLSLSFKGRLKAISALAVPPWKGLGTSKYGVLKSLILSILISACSTPDTNWPEYNGGPDRNHYSGLAQLNKENIGRLEKVWEYSSGGADTTRNQTQMQCNPIIVDGVLYGVSAGSQAFALEAATGRELWKTNFTDKTF